MPSTHTYTVNTTNSPDVTLYWSAEGTGSTPTVASDWNPGYTDNGTTTVVSGDYLRGQVAIVSNTGSFDIQVAFNAGIERNKAFKIKVYSDSAYTNLVLESSIIKLLEPLGTVSLSNESFSVTTDTASGFVDFDFNLSGTTSKDENGVTGSFTDWYTPSGSDTPGNIYEVKVDAVSQTTGHTLKIKSGGSYGTYSLGSWVLLNSGAEFRLEDTTNSGTANTSTFTVQIRDEGTQTVQSTGTYSFNMLSGAPSYDITGSNSIAEPTIGAILVPNTLNLTSIENLQEDVYSLDTINLDIQDTQGFGGTILNTGSVNANTSSSTGYTKLGYDGVYDFTAQSPDFIISFDSAASGSYLSSYRAYTQGNSPRLFGNTSTIGGTVTVVGEYTYNIVTTNVSDGTTLYWKVVPTGSVPTTSSDFIPGYDQGSAVINSNSGTITIRLNHNAAQTGDPQFKISLYSDSGFSNLIKDGSTTTLSTVTISNSVSGYSTFVADRSTADETSDNIIAYTVTTSNVPDGTTYGIDVSGTGITSADYMFSTFPFSGTNSGFSLPNNEYTVSAGALSINNNTDTFYIKILADGLTEGAETITVTLKANDGNGTATGGLSQSTIISDTSQTSATAADVNFERTDGTTALGAPPVIAMSTTDGADPSTTLPVTLQAGFVFKRDGKVYDAGTTSVRAHWVNDVSEMISQGGTVSGTLYEVRATTVGTYSGASTQMGDTLGTWHQIPNDDVGISFYLQEYLSSSDQGSSATDVWTMEIEVREIANPTTNTDTVHARATIDYSNVGGGSGEECFVPGSLVKTPTGSVNIENVSIGDLVYGQDGTTNEVLDIHYHASQQRTIYNVNGGVLETTAGHPILTNNGWAAIDAAAALAIHPELTIKTLEIGDRLILLSNTGTQYTRIVNTITSETVETELYNFDVSGDNTYSVNSVIVHNK